MSGFNLIAIAIGLSMDAFAVAVASAVVLRRVSARQVFRFAFHFGLFQGMMPVLGWLAGRSIRSCLAAWDHWVAFGLLTAIGAKAIYEAWRGEEREAPKSDPTRGLSLVLLSLATSIDALAVGVSLGMLESDIWFPVATIGLVTCALTAFGMLFATRIAQRFGQRIEILGGLILIAIGVKILLSDLLDSGL